MDRPVEKFAHELHGEIRTKTANGEFEFVDNDVCRALGIVNVGNALARIDSSDVGATDVTETYMYGDSQRTVLVQSWGYPHNWIGRSKPRHGPTESS